MNYYIQGDAANADKIKAAFEKNGIDTSANSNYGISNLFYFSCNGEVAVTQNGSIINLIKTHPDYKELELPVEPKFKNGDTIKLYGENCIIVGVDVTNQLYNIHSDNPIIGYELLFKGQDKAELVEPQPKFKVGDWLVYKNGNFFAGGLTEAQVVKVKDGVYFFASGTSGSFKFIDECCRLWTIADAKDGDVLFSLDSKQPFIYKERPQFSQARGYCCINKFGEFGVWNTSKCVICTDKYVPATKEQRELLFQKMKEAGYEWDADKKELKKIQPHYDIRNFKPFDKVLVRDEDDGKWMAAFYSHYMYEEKDYPYQFATIGTDIYRQCIPFEGNEHLLGTTDMCDEMYINW